MTNNNKRRPYRKLTDIRVDEISAVDKSAGIGTKIMLRKSAAKRDEAIAKATTRLAASVKSIIDDADCDRGAMLAKTFSQYQQHLDGLMRRYRNKNLDVAVDEANDDEGMPDDANSRRARGDDADEPTDNDGADPNGVPTKHLERLQDAMKGTTMTRDQELSNFCKRHGIIAVSKLLQDDAFMTEEEFTKLLAEDCARTGRDFSKALEGGRFGDPGDIEIAKAWAAVRDAQFLSRTSTASKAEGMPGRATLTPRVTGGRAARAVNNPKSALAELQALVDEQRKNFPALSESQAWQRVYEHPDNQELARREREENRPTSVGMR